MYTDETYKQIIRFFRLNSKLMSNLPFDYEEKSCQLMELSLRSKVWYFLMLCWTVIRCSHHIFWILSGFLHGFPSVADTTIEISFAIFTFTVCTLNIGSYSRRRTCMELFNQMLSVNKLYSENFLTLEAKIRGRHWISGKKYNDGCWQHMKLLTPSSFSCAITFGMFFLYQPHKRLYYYSYLVGTENSIVYVGLYFLLESYSLCWMMGILYFLWYCQLLYANSSSFWLDHIT